MSSVFSKSKEKRSRSSPNEANNSFVKNVTSRVSGLLPATITKWFSSPSSSNANGSAQTAEATDSSTEDEANESPIIVQPPAKRMRFSPSSNYNHYGSDTNYIPTSDNLELDTCSPYGTVQSPPGRTTFRRETNFVSTPIRSDDTTLDRTGKDTFKTHSVSTIGPSVATKRKSLFDSPNRNESSIRACAKTACNTMRDPSEPCFKPSLLGSPFYPGRTTYGGASSSYINHPNIKQRTNTHVNETSTTDNTISHSTRRIMDLLEHYSSPLIEAKRIPPYSRPSSYDSLSSFQSSTPPAKKVFSYKTQELHVPSLASILRLKQRSRLMDTTNAARQLLASHSSTSNYTPYNTCTRREQQPDKSSSNKLTTKVKSKLTRPKRGEDLETELPTPVDLPSATLQIDQNNLPKFSFGTVPEFKLVKSVKPDDKPVMGIDKPQGDKNTKIPETLTSKPDTVISTNPYKFSSPVKLCSEQPLSAVTPSFTFCSPERNIDKDSREKHDKVSCVLGASTAPEKISSSKADGWKCPDCWVTNKDVDKCACCGCAQPGRSKSEEWKCPDCWVSNKDVAQCVCCGCAKPANNKKLAKCSVCKLADSRAGVDKCINCEKVVNNVKKLPAMKPQESKRKCEDSPTSCGAPEFKNKLPNDVASGWKCEDCLIRNKISLEKCAACGASKPGAKNIATVPSAGLISTPIVKPQDDMFKSLVKTQTSKWECPSCLVSNDSDKNKCACCDSDKPGTVKDAEKKTTFNFGIIPNNTFKFGIDPKVHEASSKPEEIKPAESKKEESEKNNNVLSNTPSFSFGIPAKKADQPDAVKLVETVTKTDAPKANFSFGIPKTTTFGTPNKTAEPPKSTNDDEGNSQVVPSVFIAPAPKVAEQTTNLFAAPVTKSILDKTISTYTHEKPPISATLTLTPATSMTLNPTTSLTLNPATSLNFNPVTSLTSNPTTSERKDSTTNSITLTTAASTAPQASFTFGSGMKLSTNLFSAPVTTTPATTSMFGTPIKSATTNSTLFQAKTEPVTSNMSMFAKTDAPSATLFQKSEPTTTAPATQSTTAPLFNFGNNAQTTAVHPEKPFNFSFGSNKSESPSLFKPPFAATENKFTLPTANAVGTTIPGNTVGGNGLAIGNVLPTGNGLSINPSQNDISNNSLQNTSNIHNPTGMFGAPAKENVWSTSNNASTNLFVSNTNTSTNPLQKPAAFSFGTSTPFNANSNESMSFGNSTPSTNVFGLTNNNNNNAPSIFSTPQPAGSVFGSPQPASNPQPGVGVFGTPNVGATPTFGTPNPSIPSFEAPSLTPAPAPAFNFGTPQSTGVFGFGVQQQQQRPPQQAGGVYNFGVSGGPGLQFNMGTQPNTNQTRRVMRKAYRRNPPK